MFRLLLYPAFHFGFIAMTFEQADLGHRHCDEQNLSDNEDFGGSNLIVPNALQVLLKIGLAKGKHQLQQWTPNTL